MRHISTVILILLVTIGCKLSQGGDGSPSLSIDTDSSGKLVTRSQALVPRTFSVPPRNVYSVQFNVANSARVQGAFRVSGGSGNDIQVFIVDSEDYGHVESGQPFRRYYSSGKVSAGSIDLRLGKGTYHIVFNNKFSLFSNKAVDAEINLEQ